MLRRYTKQEAAEHYKILSPLLNDLRNTVTQFDFWLTIEGVLLGGAVGMFATAGAAAAAPAFAGIAGSTAGGIGGFYAGPFDITHGHAVISFLEFITKELYELGSQLRPIDPEISTIIVSRGELNER